VEKSAVLVFKREATEVILTTVRIKLVFKWI